MDPRIHFVTLVVADLDRARRLYTGGLGWSPALDVPDELVMIPVGEKLVLSLWAEAAAQSEIGAVIRCGALPFTLAHNVTCPEDIDAVLETAGRAGAVAHAARRRDWGGYGGYFLDPDGFRWGVAHNPHPSGVMTLP